MLYVNNPGRGRRSVTDLHGPIEAVWVDLLSGNDDERSAAERITGFRVPSSDDLTEIETSSRTYEEGGAMYFSMPVSIQSRDHHTTVTPAGFVLSAQYLLTIRSEAMPSFEVCAERMANEHQIAAPAAFVNLIDAIADRLADVLERLASELDRLSRVTFRSNEGDLLSKQRRADRELRAILGSIGRCGESLGNLRDSVLTLGRIAAYLDKSPADWFPAELRPRVTTLRQDIASLNDYEQQLNVKVGFLLDATLGFINIEQNNGVKVLTVVSVVGIPPTFVVGLYGMNFKDMPEYNWAHGYVYAWCVILLSVVIPLVWFRVKGWV